MKIMDKIIEWAFRNVRISTDRLVAICKAADLNGDGFVDLGEFVKILEAYRQELKR